MIMTYEEVRTDGTGWVYYYSTLAAISSSVPTSFFKINLSAITLNFAGATAIISIEKIQFLFVF